ncbi:hypothetical protein [Bosea sp. BH3]|uniref:hypothetical protein n=1 Tax=Bosea sp. BH3 TaxID=2871701 RepID=UPI0021CB26AE|nr:hypothetical protein [Bosea sp. BH3]MCU4178254.1 hypothetical protein [Bosea sp. BH3]
MPNAVGVLMQQPDPDCSQIACAVRRHLRRRDPNRIAAVMKVRWLSSIAFCLLAAGCSSDVRMSALRADMASRQVAAEMAASRPDATPEDKERARGYASAQSCIDQLQTHIRATQAANMATSGAMTAVGFAGPGGALAARALAPAAGLAAKGQSEFSVACYYETPDLPAQYISKEFTRSCFMKSRSSASLSHHLR